MANEFEYVNLSRNSLNISHINYFGFYKDLYCHFLTSRYVSCQLHLAKCTLTYSFTEQVIANFITLLSRWLSHYLITIIKNRLNY